MSSYIPKSITEAVKQDFPPRMPWYKGQSINYVKKRLLNRNSPLFDYINYDISGFDLNHLNGSKTIGL